MALNFPNDPEDGEIYEQFYWDATAGIWRNRQIVAELDSLADVNASAPNEGDTIIYDSVADEWSNKTIVPTGGSVGQVLVKDSATDFDAVWEDLGSGLIVPASSDNNASGWITGRTSSNFAGVSDRTFTSNAMRGNVLRVEEKTTFKGIGIFVPSTTANAGAVIRLGIGKKQKNGRWRDMDFLLDAGTVTADTSGIKEISITPITLEPGVYILLAAVQNITSGTLTVRGLSGNDPYVGVGWLASGPTWVNPGNGFDFGGNPPGGAFPLSSDQLRPAGVALLVWLERETV